MVNLLDVLGMIGAREQQIDESGQIISGPFGAAEYPYGNLYEGRRRQEGPKTPKKSKTNILRALVGEPVFQATEAFMPEAQFPWSKKTDLSGAYTPQTNYTPLGGTPSGYGSSPQISDILPSKGEVGSLGKSLKDVVLPPDRPKERESLFRSLEQAAGILGMDPRILLEDIQDPEQRAELERVMLSSDPANALIWGQLLKDSGLSPLKTSMGVAEQYQAQLPILKKVLADKSSIPKAMKEVAEESDPYRIGHSPSEIYKGLSEPVKGKLPIELLVGADFPSKDSKPSEIARYAGGPFGSIYELVATATGLDPDPAAPEKPTATETDPTTQVEEDPNKQDSSSMLGDAGRQLNEYVGNAAQSAVETGKTVRDKVIEDLSRGLKVRPDDLDEEITQLVRRLTEALDRKPGWPEVLIAFGMILTGQDGLRLIETMDQRWRGEVGALAGILQSTRALQERRQDRKFTREQLGLKADIKTSNIAYSRREDELKNRLAQIQNRLTDSWKALKPYTDNAYRPPDDLQEAHDKLIDAREGIRGKLTDLYRM
tara:strand:- start:133 stop:1761 length:1629 start_codon:yes stop_codon:yes gene_type:complete